METIASISMNSTMVSLTLFILFVLKSNLMIEIDSEPELYSESQPREEILRMLTSQNLRSPSSSSSNHQVVNSIANCVTTPIKSEPKPTAQNKEERPCCSRSIKVLQQEHDTSGGPSFPSSSLVSIRLVKSNTLPDMGSKTKSFAESPVTTRSAMVVSNSAPLIRQTSNEASSKVIL